MIPHCLNCGIILDSYRDYCDRCCGGRHEQCHVQVEVTADGSMRETGR